MNIYFTNVFTKMPLAMDREFFVSECVSWLILNIGERGLDWWVVRDKTTSMAQYAVIPNPEDAVAFKLKFGL